VVVADIGTPVDHVPPAERADRSEWYGAGVAGKLEGLGVAEEPTFDQGGSEVLGEEGSSCASSQGAAKAEG
jgi:hypothetical protein